MVKECLIRFLGIILLFHLFGCDNKLDPIQVRDKCPADGKEQFQDTSQPDGTGLITYTSHIKTILDQYCVRCHSTQKQGDARNGAPIDHNYDTYIEAKASGIHGNERIQAGSMPPEGPMPDDNKALYQQWIDEGMPE